MKPPKFDYYAPVELEEALDLLHQYSDDSTVLAGGQSLMPMLNMRLVRPSVIIDINRLGELDYIHDGPDGWLNLGSMTRQRSIERNAGMYTQAPLLAHAIPHIGHFQIRNRGTVGGSIAHADPAAELPAVCATTDARMVLSKKGSQRELPAEEFFETFFTTALEPTELLTEIRLPPWPENAGWGFQEVSRRKGDFALVGSSVLLEQDDAGTCTKARIVIFGVDGRPVRVPTAEQLLVGNRLAEADLREVERVVAFELDPPTDLHASSQYRKEVGGVLARRAVDAARARLDSRS